MNPATPSTSVALTDLPKPGAYVELWRKCYAAADAGQTVRLGWAGRDLDATTVRDAFRKALDKRINARVAMEPTGRNYQYDQEWRFRRDQQRIQDRLQRRVCVYQFETRQARDRFSHLLSSHGE